jgi:hypothetical protein
MVIKLTLNTIMSKYRHENIISEEEYNLYKCRHLKAFETQYDEDFFINILNEVIKKYKKEVRKNK